MKTMILLLLCTASGLAQEASNAYGFKGDVIGESLQVFRSRNDVQCSGDMHQGQKPEMPDYSRINPKSIVQASAAYSDALHAYERSYTPLAEILDAEADHFGEDKVCAIKAGIDIAGAGGGADFWIKSDRLDMISGQFRREYFAQVKKAIISRYGEPMASVINQYRNDAGAQFTGETATWTRSDSFIQLDEVKTGDVEASSIVIANPATRAAYAAANQKKADASF